MRSLLFFIAFLMAGTLSGQIYSQNEAPVQQAKIPADCYTLNIDLGNAALRRGDAKEALRFFKTAKNCSDAQKNSRRISELDDRIARTEEQLGIQPAARSEKADETPSVQSASKRRFTTDLPPTRRNYRANQQILKDTLEDCFHLMSEEADRAYRLRFWEDAAALYRAAKNCNDADQAGRQLMSEKIIKCRNAAENELYAKQQEAERQARHAIAANRADDAYELLEKTDRSLAFRLADFANQYIAPDDNPDCVQAIFDAWYYQPDEEIKPGQDKLYNPLFCYEIADNIDNPVQLKFSPDQDKKSRLWAFSPQNGEIVVREMPQMNVVQTLNTGDIGVFRSFDISPLEDILLAGSNYLELRRGTRQHRINFPNINNWCFSPRGDELFFENSKELKIYLVNVNQAFSQMNSRKGNKSANFMAAPVEPREFISGITPGLLDMEYFDGKFWLAYYDRTEILSKAEAGKPWKKEIVWHNGVTLPESFEQNHLRLALHPKEGFCVLTYFNQTWIIPIQEANTLQDSTLLREGLFFDNMIPLAICPQTQQIAFKDTMNYGHEGFWIIDAVTGDTLTHQHVPLDAIYLGMEGAFSPDGAWVAAVNNGIISLWALRDSPTKSTNNLPVFPDDKPLISPDGSKIFLQQDNTITVLTTEEMEPLQKWENLGTPLKGVSNHWAVIQVSPDSAEARHISNGKKVKFPLFNPGAFPYLYAIEGTEEKWVAYLTNSDKLEVRSLQTGTLIASREFDNGNISEIQFIPNRNELLIVINTESGTSSVYIWSPLQPQKAPRIMRLHQYSINTIAIDPNGRRVALTNENDIRIFDLQNIEDELLKIRSNKNSFISNLAFQPNTDFLASAYSDGKVIFWDINNGQPALALQAVEYKSGWDGSSVPSALGFSGNGSKMILTIANGKMLTYALDPSYIREVVQNETRQLQAFSFDQILEYNLESALYYPGNFERLAASNDAPLIRAFFLHFGSQALGSNNIIQVRDYCEKALYLYERLNQKTQAKWVKEMAYMYEDYAWKLLLRGNTKESKAIVNFIQKKFGHTSELMMAHIALFDNDCALSGQWYTRNFLGNGTEIKDVQYVRYEMDRVERELIQLRDYGLLDSTQLACFCGSMSLSGGFLTICEPVFSSTPTLSEVDVLRWEVYRKGQETTVTFGFQNKQIALEEVLTLSRKLMALNPTMGRGWVENALLELARFYHVRAGFEQNSLDAGKYFNSCHKLLTDYGTLKATVDTMRLSLLANNHLAFGRLLFNAGQYDNALDQFNGGLEVMNKLWPMIYQADSMLLPNYGDFVVGPLYEKLGTTYLLKGDTASARLAYERGGLYMITRGLNTLYMGCLSAMQGDEIKALADFGGIFYADQTAEAFIILDQLASRFPERSGTVIRIKKQLTDALKARNPRLVGPEAEYWYAVRRQLQFGAQNNWDSTLIYNQKMLSTAKACMNINKGDETWIQYWLDAHIGVAYYQLLAAWNQPAALNNVIKISEEAEAFLEQNPNLYYPNRELLKTNMAHALILRNEQGDRDKALNLYGQFLKGYYSLQWYDNVDLLEKDIRDLKSVGVPWPELPSFQQILEQDR
ncbi:MAG TPA: hypothetical protein DCF33_08915 [Saprospirales bacterium]|nr:hypothetical protein [Saprospirales bacterium]